MKVPPFLLLAFLTACSLFSCSRSESPTASATPAPPSKHHRLAPAGTLYLVQRVAVTTDTGVTGFPPGTKVQLVEDRGEKLVVTDGAVRFEVRGEAITNDLDIAGMAARSDAVSQQELERYLARQRDVDRQNQDEQNKLYDQQQRDANDRHTAAAINARGTNKLDRGAYHERVGYYHRRPWIYYYPPRGD